MHALLKHLQQCLPPNAKHLGVAFSGGMDSRVLLELTHQLGQIRPELQIRALHAHHNLSPQADHWASFCTDVCQSLNLPLTLSRLQIRDESGASLENRARKARYRFFEQVLLPGEILLQAHHQNDQVETLLLRLLRGAGTQGLSGMPQQRALGAGRLLRPLLDIPRRELQAFALSLQLQWIEDESNQQTHFDRNFLRLQILPQLQARFPATSNNLLRVTQLAQQSEQLQQELAELDLQTCKADAHSLDLTGLMSFSRHRRINLLRHWLQQHSLPLPGHQYWDELERLCCARNDASPLLGWGEGDCRTEARRFRQRLFIALASHFQPLPTDWQVDWDGQTPLWLPDGRCLSLQLRPETSSLLPDTSHPIKLTVRSRQGGESIKLAQRGQRDVKRLLQELNLPPWQRQQLPFIWHQDQLVAVSDLLVATGWQRQL
ncbi:tRNA lysidine(34) synthetase TilS [Marinospirillum alkaliphilum]|uniref:tRNA(Ile)-lysidine synthase n=1 Tax=Marinospirillum alkaliphilum DSM 21637 TaxID=1122209 RepID=A0A1K1VB94_9GAMM|nr:tRNA lysidine(34) synthetase TilS [Marinospirillum alkaliphilum]SFX21995.1 tRNA(Ile)-lysidine synthase [Marinospirillum alkaliphilum DSM 21637]